MDDATQTIVAPRDCALVLAIPQSRAEFLGELDEECPKTFIKNYAVKLGEIDGERLWRRYQRYAELSQSVSQEVAGYGVAVVSSATCDAFLATLPRFAVVTLVAHWEPAHDGDESGCVQFDDGMFAADSIVDQIADDYQGLLDLTVCESVVLGEAIKR